ncbi:MAG: TonB-dependent receptor [Bacteroidales bacterium]
MRKIYKLIFTAMITLITAGVFAQGTTTAGINGRIFDMQGSPLTGATILVVEKETGAQYGTISDDKGYYRLPNMNPGGPYKLTVTYVGFQNFEQDNIFLTLGQTYKVDANLSETALQLLGVEIVASTSDVFDGNRTGAETVISTEVINQMPTLGRTVGDYVRLTPQASFREGGISIAGANNRYNAISIDGAVNNDVFGLASSGTNGGQTGGTPWSMDIIDQFQVQMAPYDVRQSGFNGASINAITRRGKNEFEGTLYTFRQNQGLAGKTPWESVKDLEDPEESRSKLADFNDNIMGLSIGGPIIKDKLFFFLNSEMQRRTRPQPYEFSNYQGESDQGTLNALADMLRSRYGYDPGAYLNTDDELKSDKLFLRFDWNINKVHKLMLRHSYVNLNAIQPYRSTNQRIYFENSGQQFPSMTNSTALELKSNWNNFANNLILGFTAVRDDRNPIGSNFPSVLINDGTGTIYVGSEPFSTANKLDQDILTLNNNFSLYKGAHTITVGANVEYSHTYNLFIRQNFGEYKYNSVADFMTIGTEGEVSAFEYNRSYSLVDNITGDGSEAAAIFNTLQFGIYAQDEWQATENFKLTVGLRLDIPMFLTDNLAAPGFNDTVVPKIENIYDPVSESNYDMQGARAGQMPKPQFMWAPRIGFNWDVTGEQTTQIRGGAGIFTGRLPLVWPGGAYNNNGVTIGGVRYRYPQDGSTPINFIPEYDAQYQWEDFYTGQSPIPSGQIDLFVEDFKYPQILRASLALDQKLPWGIVGTLEGIYTKTLNNIYYYNYNAAPATKRMTGGPDDRWIIPSNKVENRYDRIMVGANTSEGFSYNITAQLQKNFSSGLQSMVAYTYGRSKSMNDGLSSQNSSQWRYVANINGRNNLDLSYSNFDLGSRLMAFISYKKAYANNFATGISFFYDGVSGKRFSYVYNNSRIINGEASDNYALIWIPNDLSEINLVEYTSGGTTYTVEEQWENLNSFIEGDKYLADNRGGYAERNSARIPFESYLDMRFVQDFYIKAGKTRHTLQFTLDIFNVLNLLNKEWGVHRFVNFDSYQLIRIEGFEEDGTSPRFTYRGGSDHTTAYNVSDPASRWRMQIGIRYIFGTKSD